MLDKGLWVHSEIGIETWKDGGVLAFSPSIKSFEDVPASVSVRAWLFFFFLGAPPRSLSSWPMARSHTNEGASVGLGGRSAGLNGASVGSVPVSVHWMAMMDW